MRRKILMGVLAVALPAGTLLITQSAAVAGGSTPPNGPVSCGVQGTVNFASPGLSKNGSESSSKTSSTTTSGTTLIGCSGSVPNQTIVTKNVKCAKTDGQPASNPACAGKGTYGYDSWNNFETSGTTSIAKSLKKVTFTIDGVTYSTKTTAAAVTSCTSGTYGTEAGFKISGEVKGPKNDKGESSTLTVCLGSDAGTDTSGNFNHDFLENASSVITSAGIDGTTSTVAITG